MGWAALAALLVALVVALVAAAGHIAVGGNTDTSFGEAVGGGQGGWGAGIDAREDDDHPKLSDTSTWVSLLDNASKMHVRDVRCQDLEYAQCVSQGIGGQVL